MAYQHTLNSNNLTLTYVSNDSNVTFPASKDPAVDDNDSTPINFTNNQNPIYITYTFDVKQLLGKISFIEGSNIRDFEIQVSTNGTDYTTVESVTDRNTPSLSEYTLSLNYIKYKSFRLKVTEFNTQNNIVLFELRAFAYDPARKDYNVEFDDALLDLAGWKNPRFEGSKLTGEKRNQFNSGDVSYGLNPVVEHKTSCIFLGKDIDEGNALDKDTPLTEVMNHSYLTIDKILFINSETDDVEIVARENMNERAFNRLVTENFPEGSSVVVKSLEDQKNKLKPRHFVKFNQGQLMKVYSYTANEKGHDDGVFGGHEVYEHKGDNKSIVSGSGLFGFGQSAFVSASLFNTESIQFTTLFPAELSFYEGNYSTETMGSQLVNASASISSSNSLGSTVQEAAEDAFGKSVDEADTSGDDESLKVSSDIRLKENIIYLGKSISGIPIYTFNYIGRKEEYMGTMAQDLIKLGRIDAVKLNNDGYYSVYYNKIDVNFNII